MVGGKKKKRDEVALLCVSWIHIFHKHIEGLGEAYSASCWYNKQLSGVPTEASTVLVGGLNCFSCVKALGKRTEKAIQSQLVRWANLKIWSAILPPDNNVDLSLHNDLTVVKLDCNCNFICEICCIERDKTCSGIIDKCAQTFLNHPWSFSIKIATYCWKNTVNCGSHP